ncbi:MAG TPA: SRPBCC domain-containing protein [Candidatus Limnocylindrales bacterium]|nr:SRPBCC domain-containing protein [Candidatus Limnocylindrales bacterium]
MSELLRETLEIAGAPEEIWSILEDLDALRRVMPGAESLTPDGAGRFRGVLVSKIQFMTIRADVTATFHDAEPPRHLRLEIDGRPRGLAASFRASVPFDIEPTDGGRSQVSYAVDLTVTGRLSAFGVPLLRDTMRRQIAELVRNIGRELADRA